MAALNIPFDAGRRQMFICALSVDGGLQKSCDTVGINYKTYLRHYKKDKEFAAEVDAAIRLIGEEFWAAAKSRFIKGVPEPIIGGKNKDQIITTVQRYSDSFIGTLAKKLDPEFANAHGTGAFGGKGANGLAGTDVKSGVLLSPLKLTEEEFCYLYECEVDKPDAV